MDSREDNENLCERIGAEQKKIIQYQDSINSNTMVCFMEQKILKDSLQVLREYNLPMKFTKYKKKHPLLDLFDPPFERKEKAVSKAG